MPEQGPRSRQDKNSRNFGNDNNFNWRGILLFAFAITLLGVFFFSRNGGYGNVEDIPFTEFQQYLNEGRISKDERMHLVVTEGKTTQVLRGACDKERKPGAGSTSPDRFKTTVFLEFNKDLKSELENKGYKVDIRADSDVMLTALLNFAPIALFFFLIYLLFRQQIRNAGKGALSFGKSKARMLARDRNRVTFKDVAGVEEAKEEEQEIVDFLKDPKKFQKLGGRIPTGVLMAGPPGKGREEVLRVRAKRVKLAECVDLGVAARGTPGYSGAELANVINEAALLAARRGLKAITMAELEESRDKVRWGKERRSLAISEKEKENTAYHEAGHALLCELLDHTDPVHKVTIIPRGPSLGSTMYLPAEEKYNNRKNELLDRLVVIMGGRVAEEMIFGDVTSGASGDIRMATGIARKMVCEWGMSERLGMVEYGEHDDFVFLVPDISRSKAYTEATAQEIDREVKRLCDDSYQRAMKALTHRKDVLIAIAKALLEYETLDGSQVRGIINYGKLINLPPPIPPVRIEPRPDDRPEPEGLGGLTEAPV